MRRIFYANALTLLFLFYGTYTLAQRVGHENIDSVKIITNDIKNYLNAYEKAVANPAKADSIYQAEYFDKGSIGLRDYFARRIKTVSSFVRNQQQKPRFYKAVSVHLQNVDDQIPVVIDGLKALKQIFPEASFTDVYLLIGRWNSAGTASENGLLLSLDMISKAEDVPTDELNEWESNVYKPIAYLPYIVVHELIHTIQSRPAGPPTLLQMAIREGMADYITELATGVNPSDHIYKWAKPKEKELWDAFKMDMYDDQPNGWMVEKSKNPDLIPDLGYFIGYQIVDAYYKKAADKSDAIRQLLTTNDYKAIFDKSDYLIK